MRTFRGQAAYVASHPGVFALGVLRAFRANQGLLLAGAVAYYTLLSIVPLLILMLIALSQIIDQGELLATLGRYLEWLIPGQSPAMIGELARFLDHRAVIGWALLVTAAFVIAEFGGHSDVAAAAGRKRRRRAGRRMRQSAAIQQWATLGTFDGAEVRRG